MRVRPLGLFFVREVWGKEWGLYSIGKKGFLGYSIPIVSKFSRRYLCVQYGYEP